MAGVLDVEVRLAVVVAAFLPLPLIVGQMEHKAMAHMQARISSSPVWPSRAGRRSTCRPRNPRSSRAR